METILIILSVGILNIVCFFIGTKAGSKEPIQNPVTIYKEHREMEASKEEAKKQKERLDAILANVDRYDGTAAGQEDI